MSPELCYGYLILKYFIIAHVLDVGYSKARNIEYKHRDRALVYHTGLQLLITFWIISQFSFNHMYGNLIFEACLLMVTALIERYVSIYYAVKTFVTTELAMALGYLLIVYKVIH